LDGIWSLLSLVVLAHPLVYFGQLETKESSHTVSREPPFTDPSINRVLGHPKVGCHIVDGNPAFFSGHFNPLVSYRNLCLCMPMKPDIYIQNPSIPVKDKLLEYREPAACLAPDGGQLPGFQCQTAPNTSLKLPSMRSPVTRSQAGSSAPFIRARTRTRR